MKAAAILALTLICSCGVFQQLAGKSCERFEIILEDGRGHDGTDVTLTCDHYSITIPTQSVVSE